MASTSYGWRTPGFHSMGWNFPELNKNLSPVYSSPETNDVTIELGDRSNLEETVSVTLSMSPKMGKSYFSGTRWRIVIALFAIFSFLVLLLTCRIVIGASSKVQYSIVIDCGSTGTRLYIYEWRGGDDGTLPNVKVMGTGVQGEKGKAYNRKETEPGLDKFVGDKEGLKEKALMPLLDWAAEKVSKYSQKNTALFLFATAGLRKIPEKDANWVMEEVRDVLENSPFYFKREWARIISGVDEAVYGWIALNYLLGQFGQGHEYFTMGSLDLGGSSLEVTFVPPRFPVTQISTNVTIKSRNYHIYAHSHAGYGMNDGFDRSVTLILESMDRYSQKRSGSKQFEGERGKTNLYSVENVEIEDSLPVVFHPCLQKGYNQTYKRSKILMKKTKEEREAALTIERERGRRLLEIVPEKGGRERGERANERGGEGERGDGAIGKTRNSGEDGRRRGDGLTQWLIQAEQDSMNAIIATGRDGWKKMNQKTGEKKSKNSKDSFEDRRELGEGEHFYANSILKEEIRLVGEPDWDRCQALAGSVIRAAPKCSSENCALGVEQPPLRGKFYALTGFFVVYHFFGLPADAPLDQLLEKSQIFCSLPWDEVEREFGEVRGVDRNCFRAPYVVSLLREGLGLLDSQITIGSGDMSWTIGAALYEAGSVIGGPNNRGILTLSHENDEDIVRKGELETDEIGESAFNSTVVLVVLFLICFVGVLVTIRRWKSSGSGRRMGGSARGGSGGGGGGGQPSWIFDFSTSGESSYGGGLRTGDRSAKCRSLSPDRFRTRGGRGDGNERVHMGEDGGKGGGGGVVVERSLNGSSHQARSMARRAPSQGDMVRYEQRQGIDILQGQN